MASGDQLEFWGANVNEAPLTGFATFDLRNGQPVLDFAANATRTAIFSGTLPAAYAGGGLTLDLLWMASAATAGNAVWGAALERRNTDADADSFAPQQTATGTANATSGVMTITSIAFSSGAAMDSIQPNDPYRLQIQRLPGNGSDTMLGDAELVSATLRET